MPVGAPSPPPAPRTAAISLKEAQRRSPPGPGTPLRIPYPGGADRSPPAPERGRGSGGRLFPLTSSHPPGHRPPNRPAPNGRRQQRAPAARLNAAGPRAPAPPGRAHRRPSAPTAPLACGSRGLTPPASRPSRPGGTVKRRFNGRPRRSRRGPVGSWRRAGRAAAPRPQDRRPLPRGGRSPTEEMRLGRRRYQLGN